MSDILYSNRGLQMRFDLDFDTVNMRLWVLDQMISGTSASDIVALVTHRVSEICYSVTAEHPGDLSQLRANLVEELKGPDQGEFIAAFKKSYGAAPLVGLAPESDILELENGNEESESGESN